MAMRRMLSRSIVESAKFLKMPQSTQNLYFHLVVNADDDGVVEAYSVIRLINSNEDDLRVLSAKEFVTILNVDLVTYIRDWRLQNKVRADRKTDSVYKELLLSVVPEASLLEKKERSDIKQHGRSTDGPRTAQYSIEQCSIEQYSIGQSSVEQEAGEEIIVSLASESITKNQYNKLISEYGTELVNRKIRKIIKTPYRGCLNEETIAEWCKEERSKNSFNNFAQRNDYNFAELEEHLLGSSHIERRRDNNERK